MKWSDKTKEQYGAHCSLIMGADNEHELHLSEDDLNTLTLALQLVVSWANDDEYPAPDTPDTWEEVKEFIKNDLQSILELQQNIEKIDVSEIPSSEVLELDEIRLKRGLISPVDFIEQKKRQFINEGIQELITDD